MFLYVGVPLSAGPGRSLCPGPAEPDCVRGLRRRGRLLFQSGALVAFSTFGLHPDLMRGVKDLGFTRPTPIQSEAIPPAMTGSDLLACAMTGSGKMVAFLLPILHRLMGSRRGTTRALILTPTREL